MAYILTRPLGANLGDFLALPKSEGGLGFGTAATSIIFLAAILATVMYLTVTRSDVIEVEQPREAAPRDPQRERIMVGYFAVVAIAAGGILAFAHAQPHAAAAAAEEGPAPTGTTLTPQQATQNFPAAEIAKLRTITQGTLTIVQAGDQPPRRPPSNNSRRRGTTTRRRCNRWTRQPGHSSTDRSTPPCRPSGPGVPTAPPS